VKTFDDFMDTFDSEALAKECSAIIAEEIRAVSGEMEAKDLVRITVALTSGLTQVSTHNLMRLLRAYHEWFFSQL
jgi:hypothetical protein